MTGPQRCVACKRRLKRPSPTGLGPVCERRLNGRPPAVSSPAHTDIHPDQTALDLRPMQPTLWSI